MPLNTTYLHNLIVDNMVYTIKPAEEQRGTWSEEF